MVIMVVHRNHNHGSQWLKNLILTYNHVSQKIWKNQITRTRKLWVLYWFFHENHKLLKAFEIMRKNRPDNHQTFWSWFFSKTWNWWFSDAETLEKSEPAVHSNDHTTLIHTSLHISQTQPGNPSLPLGRHPPTHQLPNNVLGDDEITFRRQLLLLYLLSLACTYTGSLVIKFSSPPAPAPRIPPPSSPSSVAQLQH